MSKVKLGLGILVGLTVFAVLIGQARATFPPGFDKVPPLPDKAYFGVFHNPNQNLGVGPFVKDEIIVRYKGDSEPFRVVKLPEGKSVWEAKREFELKGNVEYAEPNYIAYAFMVPNDPYYPYQWHLNNSVYGGIQTEKAWDISTGSGVTVAIVDTGIAYENYGRTYKIAPDLVNTCFVPGYDFVNNDSHPNDDNSHGTHVAGTVAQSTNNGIGVAGVAFNSCLMPVKVLNKNGSGTYAQVADGIYWAVDHGAKVINLSLGGSSPSTTLEDAVAYAYNRGVTVVAACGNDSLPSCAYPAAYDSYVIAVGATRYDETLAYYSNYGPSLDLVAPGGDLTVDQNGDGYGDGVLQNTFNPNTKNTRDFGYWFFQGTSMAAPHVSGTAALLIAKGNATTPTDVRTALQETAKDKGTPGWDSTYGWGIVDAYKALQWTKTPDTTPPVISEVATANITSTSATVNWTTDEPSNSVVNYGTTTALGSTISDVAMVTSHSLNLTGLAKNTTYYYEVQATDASGNTAVDNNGGLYYTFVTLLNQPPVANAGPDQTIYVGDVVTFNGSASYDPDGTIVSYNWDFGDGTTGTGVTVSHTYAATGTYTVTLTVTDNDGATGIDTALVNISEKPAQVLCWSGSNQYLYRNNGQAQKFCKCAQGTYGYNDYNYTRGRETVYYYLDSWDNTNWEVNSGSSHLPVYQVTCTDGTVYPTNQDYYYPK